MTGQLNRVFRSLLFWLVVTSGIALCWPVGSLGFDPFLATPMLLWSLIVVTMFSLGTLVDPQELGPLREKPWWVMLGVLVQLTVMPLAAWLVTRVIELDDELAAGVILVGCVPGAMASNVLTSTARGSVAYSVSLTSVATILSPLTVPGVLWLVSGIEAEHSLATASIRLAVLVVLPTVGGYLLARKFNAIRSHASRWSPRIASIALLWIIAAVVAANRQRLAGVGVMLVVALLAINLVGYAAGYGAGALLRLPAGYRRALTLEVGMQNAGLGTALASSLYGASTIATIPTAAYTFGCMLTGTILAVFWHRSEAKGHGQVGDSGLNEDR